MPRGGKLAGRRAPTPALGRRNAPIEHVTVLPIQRTVDTLAVARELVEAHQ